MSAKSITTPTILARTIKRALHGFGIGSEINAHLAPGEEYDTDRVVMIDRPQPDGSVDTFLVTVHRIGVEPQVPVDRPLTKAQREDMPYFEDIVAGMNPQYLEHLQGSLEQARAETNAKIAIVRRAIESKS